ncbi:hypothetical protein OSB04_013505 [Centaurea solstitialis]|uniref:PORR domain-containing protein n=1 Tax=Centaurea solstitialis TaxID=347529 RepID=A0AA38WRB3_9ASTR|nr:hypothetical protein OSB04_013505 [Centaurea solstitialis]
MSESLANKLQKLLMLSSHHRILLSKLVHIGPDLGLPPNFRSRLCNNYPEKFKTVDTSYGRALELVSCDIALAKPMPVLDVEPLGLIVDRPLKFKRLRLRKGRNVRRHHEEFLIKFREITDVCPYRTKVGEFPKESIKAEKRACDVKEFGLPNQLRAMLLRHPELFYVSFKGQRDSVFLVEGYDDNGKLLEKDETSILKDLLLDLVKKGKWIRREIRRGIDDLVDGLDELFESDSYDSENSDDDEAASVDSLHLAEEGEFWSTKAASMFGSDDSHCLEPWSVSKSWHSLISNPNFVKAHLKHSHLRDRNDDGIGNRRIVMSILHCCYKHRLYEGDDTFYDARECHLLGSSNGLVCVSPRRSEVLLVNPETREVSKLKNPQIAEAAYVTGGFGYDTSTDDYKVVLGFLNSGFTCFKVFSLKSNAWKIIGDVCYPININRVGILCNGALHWVAEYVDRKKIICFDLSEDRIKEIPQPDHVLYKVDMVGYSSMRLGTLDDRLCVFRRKMVPFKIWVMNEYNVKRSWELVDPESKIECEGVHRLKDLKHYIPNKRSFCHETWIVRSPEFLGSFVYVPSLVSPHVCRKPKRKRQETGSTKSVKR